ncbi:hypothetical protein SYNPS1DRAFT_26062 [Syncephalis pseudoplumigaleata]|uniref:Uncharacterized protein n=1 Tax=Syncephalis pseudoplumigaleata TaxID=1712513 RepID=A0A4P9YR06_9FUNG|nr:hypothetical protein SYNPS1DRAFT_26062 [Syncephalis pseudoplumigaleata]|eukprot:RKP22266.1 hypothetical protein SYNPS1DRAFT_26062 [Syncephalis pseudoplumigaleata]
MIRASAIVCLFAFPKLGQKARIAGIYLLERLHEDGASGIAGDAVLQFNAVKTGALTWLLGRLKRTTPSTTTTTTTTTTDAAIPATTDDATPDH